MNETILNTIRLIEGAQTSEEETRGITSLAQMGEKAIPDLLEYANPPRPKPIRRKVVLKILQAMGYPVNRAALPMIISEVANINGFGYEIAITILKDIGAPAIPDVRDALHFYIKDHDFYSLSIQGICAFLNILEPTIITPLLPELIHLLEMGTDENCITDYAIDPIRRIGSPVSNSAISLIGKKIQQLGSASLRVSLINALQDFELTAVQPLEPLLTSLLSDQSEIVRVHAMNILARLKI